MINLTVKQALLLTLYSSDVLISCFLTNFKNLNFYFQFDSKGRNFLHLAIQNVDVETVLFLIGVSANVNSRIRDSSNRTPLHLAVSAGSEIVVRHVVRV